MPFLVSFAASTNCIRRRSASPMTASAWASSCARSESSPADSFTGNGIVRTSAWSTMVFSCPFGRYGGLPRQHGLDPRLDLDAQRLELALEDRHAFGSIDWPATAIGQQPTHRIGVTLRLRHLGRV